MPVSTPIKKIVVRENSDPFDIFEEWEIEYTYFDGSMTTETADSMPNDLERQGFYYDGHSAGEFTWRM